MRYLRSKRGYYYKEYSGGARVRISKKTYQIAKQTAGRKIYKRKKRRRKGPDTHKKTSMKLYQGDFERFKETVGDSFDNFYIIDSHGSHPRGRNIKLRQGEFVIMNCKPGTVSRYTNFKQLWEYAFAAPNQPKDWEEGLLDYMLEYNLFCVFSRYDRVPNLRLSPWEPRYGEHKNYRFGLYKLPIEYYVSKKEKKRFFYTLMKKGVGKKGKTGKKRVPVYFKGLSNKNKYLRRPYVHITSDHKIYPYKQYVSLQKVIKDLRKRTKGGFVLIVYACRAYSGR